jgi:hypothetical protein
LDLKLADNQNAEQRPKVSKLPLPVSDSPLVIDLPDGQKIVIGKMTEGSVIEVATWRGVGRPDSRTSRLMLGVGNGNVNQESDGQSSSSTPKKASRPNDWRIILFYLNLLLKKIAALPWEKFLRNLKPRRGAKVSDTHVKSESTSATQPTSNDALPVDDDIEAWLNKISEKATQQSTAAPHKVKKATKVPVASKKTVKKSAKPKAKRK